MTTLFIGASSSGIILCADSMTTQSGEIATFKSECVNTLGKMINQGSAYGGKTIIDKISKRVEISCNSIGNRQKIYQIPGTDFAAIILGRVLPPWHDFDSYLRGVLGDMFKGKDLLDFEKITNHIIMKLHVNLATYAFDNAMSWDSTIYFAGFSEKGKPQLIKLELGCDADRYFQAFNFIKKLFYRHCIHSKEILGALYEALRTAKVNGDILGILRAFFYDDKDEWEELKSHILVISATILNMTYWMWTDFNLNQVSFFYRHSLSEKAWASIVMDYRMCAENDNVDPRKRELFELFHVSDDFFNNIEPNSILADMLRNAPTPSSVSATITDSSEFKEKWRIIETVLELAFVANSSSLDLGLLDNVSSKSVVMVDGYAKYLERILEIERVSTRFISLEELARLGVFVLDTSINLANFSSSYPGVGYPLSLASIRLEPASTDDSSLNRAPKFSFLKGPEDLLENVFMKPPQA